MDPATSELTCPRCGATMKAAGRKGALHTCPQCHSVFIDRADRRRGPNPLAQAMMSVVMSVVVSVVVSRVVRRLRRPAAS